MVLVHKNQDFMDLHGNKRTVQSKETCYCFLGTNNEIRVFAFLTFKRDCTFLWRQPSQNLDPAYQAFRLFLFKCVLILRNESQK